MNIVDNYYQALDKLKIGKDVVLLGLRLALAYGFYEPAKAKWGDIASTAEWFAGMGLPFPTLNAYLAAGTEAAGVLLLGLGLGVRIIAFPLAIVMLVAIKTVHWDNGFAASDNGYEIPLYYLLMLAVLVVLGGGRASADYLVDKQLKK